MSDILKIDGHVPLPKLIRGGRSGPKPDIYTRTIDALEVGQSFVWDGAIDKAISSRLTAACGRNHARYTYRSIEGADAVRVWRVS